MTQTIKLDIIYRGSFESDALVHLQRERRFSDRLGDSLRNRQHTRIRFGRAMFMNVSQPLIDRELRRKETEGLVDYETPRAVIRHQGPEEPHRD